MKNKTFTAKQGNWKKSQTNAQGVKKRKWVPEHKVFEGNLKEGKFFLNTTNSLVVAIDGHSMRFWSILSAVLKYNINIVI